MTLFDVICQVKLDQWVILALATFSSHLSNLPHPQIKVEDGTSNF